MSRSRPRPPQIESWPAPPTTTLLALLPLAAVVSGLVDFAIAFVMLIVMALYYGMVPTTAALLLPAFLLLAILTALAAGLWPFVLGDALKALLAAGLLPAAWRLTR